MIRAARLDASLYAEVKENGSATAHAVIVVVLVALVHGAGGIVRSSAFGRDRIVESFVIGVAGEIAFWAIASSAIYAVGRYVFGVSITTYDQVMRTFGFACTPGLLILVAAVTSVYSGSGQVLVLVMIVVWRMAAGFLAVRQVLGLDIGRSVITLLVGTICGLLMLGASTAIVLEVLTLARY